MMKSIKDLGPNEVVHCKTEEEAQAIVELMNRNGANWGGTFYYQYKNKTFYRPFSNTFGNIDESLLLNDLIHPAADFIYKENKNNMINQIDSSLPINQVTIDIPLGFEIDQDNSDLLKGIVKFKPVKKGLPTKWEDLENVLGYYVELDCSIQEVTFNPGQTTNEDRNVWPTEELAEASLALCQLVRLRDIYNDGWQADWTDSRQQKYVLYFVDNKLFESYSHGCRHFLSFKDKETRALFSENFKDLILQAKPLL